MSHNYSNCKKETFTVTAPGAASVLLAADFTEWHEWPIPMRQERGGHWKAIVELEPGTYHYRFVVDGQWRGDPESRFHTPNAFGGEDAVRQVV